MLDKAYEAGRAAALARFKLANMTQGAAGYNPALNGQATGTTPAMPARAATAPTAPMAAHAGKANVLG